MFDDLVKNTQDLIQTAKNRRIVIQFFVNDHLVVVSGNDPNIADSIEPIKEELAEKLKTSGNYKVNRNV